MDKLIEAVEGFSAAYTVLNTQVMSLTKGAMHIMSKCEVTLTCPEAETYDGTSRHLTYVDLWEIIPAEWYVTCMYPDNTIHCTCEWHGVTLCIIVEPDKDDEWLKHLHKCYHLIEDMY